MADFHADGGASGHFRPRLSGRIGVTGGWSTLAIGTLACLGIFAVGLMVARMPTPPSRPMVSGGKPSVSMPVMGRLFQAGAILFGLLWPALCFGLLGPIDNIRTIQIL